MMSRLTLSAAFSLMVVCVGCRRSEQVAVQDSRSSVVAAPALSTSAAAPTAPSATVVDSAPPIARAKCWDAELKAAVGSTSATPLTDGTAISQEIENAVAGKPRRITIAAHTGVTVNCECPFFALDADGVGSGFLHPEYQGDVGRGVAWAVRGTYRLTGYYSGRLLNTYEQFNEHLEPGEEPIKDGTGDDEQRYYWPQRHPEFCVESWCFTPGAHWKEDPRTENQPKELAEMRRLGGRFCK